MQYVLLIYTEEPTEEVPADAMAAQLGEYHAFPQHHRYREPRPQRPHGATGITALLANPRIPCSYTYSAMLQPWLRPQRLSQHKAQDDGADSDGRRGQRHPTVAVAG